VNEMGRVMAEVIHPQFYLYETRLYDAITRSKNWLV
jgi:hypothetical protein